MPTADLPTAVIPTAGMPGAVGVMIPLVAMPVADGFMMGCSEPGYLGPAATPHGKCAAHATAHAALHTEATAVAPKRPAEFEGGSGQDVAPAKKAKLETAAV